MAEVKPRSKRKSRTNSRLVAASGSGTKGRVAGLKAETQPGGAFQPTSLKLPVALKGRIEELARGEGVSPHAFMLNTLSAAAERANLRKQFQQDALDALAGMKQSGKGFELGEVRNYFAKLAAFREGQGSKPRKPGMTEVV